MDLEQAQACQAAKYDAVERLIKSDNGTRTVQDFVTVTQLSLAEVRETCTSLVKAGRVDDWTLPVGTSERTDYENYMLEASSR